MKPISRNRARVWESTNGRSHPNSDVYIVVYPFLKGVWFSTCIFGNRVTFRKIKNGLYVSLIFILSQNLYCISLNYQNTIRVTECNIYTLRIRMTYLHVCRPLETRFHMYGLVASMYVQYEAQVLFQVLRILAQQLLWTLQSSLCCYSQCFGMDSEHNNLLLVMKIILMY